MLKRKLIIFLTGCMLLISSAAFAGDLGLLKKKPESLFPTSEFKIGYQGMYKYYDEPGLMNESGFLNGGFGSWTGYFTGYKIMTSIDLEAVVGSMNYDGHYNDGTPLKCDTDDYLLGGRALLGVGFEEGNIGFTPYIGIGVRHWYDKIKATGGYERFIHQYYLPLGFKLQSRLNDTWSVGGSLEGDLLLSGTVKSKLSQVGSHFDDAENEQDFASGRGFRVSAFVEHEFDNYALGLEPYFRYWHFDDSKKDRINFNGSEAYVIEPENKSYLSGIRIYIKF